MQTNLKIKNIVLAGLFNPSTFDKYFFIKNNIATDEEILNTSTFDAIGAIQVVCPRFNIVITFNQIVISDNNPENNIDEIRDIAVSIINNGGIALNTTALGINFHWFLADSNKSLQQISKEHFYNDKIDIFNKYFNSDNSLFGAYASTNFKDARLKLDIKPHIVHNLPTENQDLIGCQFNFHFDIKNKIEGADVLKYLGEYELYKMESDKIISNYR